MKLSADLSVDSIEQLIKDLEKYRDDTLVQKTNKLAEVLAKKGIEIAQANVVSLEAVFTGELFNSIHLQKDGLAFLIVADSEHAAFVEFGTGQIGEAQPYTHPFPDGVSWEYNTGSHIFEVSPGQYGWIYKGKDDKYYFTQGMPARPFMYETVVQLMKIVASTAKEVFA